MNKSLIFTAIGMLAAGLLAGYWFAGESGDAPPAASGDARQPLFYRNPMNPLVTSPVPAKDAMGMEYIPVYADDDSDEKDSAGTVKVDAVVAQNIGVRTAVARSTSITRTIRAVARVAFNEAGLFRLHSKVEGWIEELRVNKTGEYV
ncbi:MAG: efflux RND transporter periplasmic adaptor subunit, partial [Proteobacteria bacterium]|nr:efflux RND transporter periplasmic adaptor subunit [Pseudomonadota bacterium]